MFNKRLGYQTGLNVVGYTLYSYRANFCFECDVEMLIRDVYIYLQQNIARSLDIRQTSKQRILSIKFLIYSEQTYWAALSLSFRLISINEHNSLISVNEHNSPGSSGKNRLYRIFQFLKFSHIMIQKVKYRPFLQLKEFLIGVIRVVLHMLWLMLENGKRKKSELLVNSV